MRSLLQICCAVYNVVADLWTRSPALTETEEPENEPRLRERFMRSTGVVLYRFHIRVTLRCRGMR